MKIDLYTKAVLTVIACCLLYLVAKDIAIVARAQAAQTAPLIDVNIVQIAGRSIPGLIPALPVKIER